MEKHFIILDHSLSGCSHMVCLKFIAADYPIYPVLTKVKLMIDYWSVCNSLVVELTGIESVHCLVG